MTETSEFAKMFEASTSNLSQLYEGKKVTGTIISITRDNVFVDLGGRSEGIIDKKDLLNSKGELKYKEGDQIKATCMGLQDGYTKLAVKINTVDVDSSGRLFDIHNVTQLF